MKAICREKLSVLYLYNTINIIDKSKHYRQNNLLGLRSQAFLQTILFEVKSIILFTQRPV